MLGAAVLTVGWRRLKPIATIGYGTAALTTAMASEDEWCFSDWNMTAVSVMEMIDCKQMLLPLLLLPRLLSLLLPRLLSLLLPRLLPRLLSLPDSRRIALRSLFRPDASNS